MTNQHPITPPPELMQQWATEYWGNPGESIGQGERYIATQAAQWGADQELEACCAEMLWQEGRTLAAKLRDRRRPKPPSLKEQALKALEAIPKLVGFESERDAIRRALEQLPND